MKNISKIANILVIVFMAMFIAQGTEIEGRIRLTGTSLFPTLVLTTADDVTYYFDDELMEDFVEYQHQIVKIYATKIENEERKLADGSRTFIRPTIYKVEFLEVLSSEQ